MLTENDFDFTSTGFPNELFRVGGVQMVREYEGRKQNQIDEIEESKRSLKIYERAYACYRPECGESNAESAERHELIAAKVLELTEQRQGKQQNQTRIQNHFHTANEMKHVIDNKQRRTTTRRERLTKEANAKMKEVNLLNEMPIQTIQQIYTNNTQTYDFEEDSYSIPKGSDPHATSPA
jgi:hypothetical protein